MPMSTPALSVSERLLMVTPSSSHWLSLLFRNSSRAFIPRKLLELGREPTVVGMLVEGSPAAVSQRLLNGPALWVGGFSGVESWLLLLLLLPPPLPPPLPRVLPGRGGLVSPLWPDTVSLCPLPGSEQLSLQQSSLQWSGERAAMVTVGPCLGGDTKLCQSLGVCNGAQVRLSLGTPKPQQTR